MRVAHFVHRYPPALGGSEAYFARLSRYLANQGGDVEVFTTNALDLEAFWSKSARRLSAGTEVVDSVRVHRHAIRHWPLRRYVLKALSLTPIARLQCAMLPCNPICPSLWRAAGQETGFDLVHATAFPYGFPLLCGLRLARRCRVPYLLTPFLHLGDPEDANDRTRGRYLSRGLRYLLRAADRIFVQTKIEQAALLQLGIPDEKLVLLGMGVDPGECTGGDRQRARERWGLSGNALVIGHLANKSVEKGTVDLLQSLQQVPLREKSFTLLLAGPEMPNFVHVWKSLAGTVDATEMKVSGIQVVRLGALSEKEKCDFFAAIDIFAMPSRSDSFGIVFLEAWANGVPCVAYRSGGVAEVIRHENDGLLAYTGNLAELAAHVGKLIDDAGMRRSMGEAGKDRVSREFRWPPRLESVRRVYEEVRAERGNP
jgi:glycosyltransferase involved in cell wall biosynthesis